MSFPGPSWDPQLISRLLGFSFCRTVDLFMGDADGADDPDPPAAGEVVAVGEEPF